MRKRWTAQAGNMIERPMQVTQLVKEALDNKFPSLSEAQKLSFAAVA